MATSGFEQWAAVVGKALMFGNPDKDSSMQALASFQAKTMAKLQQKVRPHSILHVRHVQLLDLSTSQPLIWTMCDIPCYEGCQTFVPLRLIHCRLVMAACLESVFECACERGLT